MKTETSATVATAAAAALGLSWWSLATAFIGAAAGLHFDREEAPSQFLRTVLAIAMMAVLAVLVGGIASFVLPHVWGGFAEVPQPLWSGIAGVFSKPLHKRLKRETDERKIPGG
ncbi:hypothetical protein [Pseudoxanthomonas mexicana]|jgi:hypothetical protein